MDLQALAAEFPREAVHWRVQGKPYERNGVHSAMALAYIDARDVMDRLDEVCGPGGWQDSYTETASGRVICTLSILIDGEWVSKSDGAGGTQVEAEKGGISDALKRAAVKWGIGRYLYRLDSPWVRCTVNTKGGWRSWDEDPWSKVKRVPYHVAAKAPEAPTVSEEEADVLEQLAKQAGTDRAAVFKAMKLTGDTWADFPAEHFNAARIKMQEKIATQRDAA